MTKKLGYLMRLIIINSGYGSKCPRNRDLLVSLMVRHARESGSFKRK
jgi:hypothetical protein